MAAAIRRVVLARNVGFGVARTPLTADATSAVFGEASTLPTALAPMRCLWVKLRCPSPHRLRHFREQRTEPIVDERVEAAELAFLAWLGSFLPQHRSLVSKPRCPGRGLELSAVALSKDAKMLSEPGSGSYIARCHRQRLCPGVGG